MICAEKDDQRRYIQEVRESAMSRKDINRRKFVKRGAAAGIGLSVVPTAAAETTELSGDETDRAVSTATRTDSFSSVNAVLRSNGLSPQPSEATASRVIDKDSDVSGTRVRVPFTSRGDERAAAFVFSDGDATRTVSGVYRGEQLVEQLYAAPGTTSASDVLSWTHTPADSLGEAISPREYQEAVGDRVGKSAIDVPGYNYTGTYSLDDICFAVAGACTGLFLATLINPLPLDEAIVGTGCSVAGGACFIKSAAKRYANCSEPEVVLYTQKIWNPVGPQFVGYPTC